MKPTLRLTWRLAPYMLYGLAVLFLIVITFAAILIVGLHGGLDLITLLGVIFSIFAWSMITKGIGGNELTKELKERNGKPIKVFRTGKWNYRFMKNLGWGYPEDYYYVVWVNPLMDKFSFVKYLYLLDPNVTEFSNQLLEVAVTNEKAFEEISSKVRSGKYRASSDLRKYEGAIAVSESIADIMK
jgi:hypothetical protein